MDEQQRVDLPQEVVQVGDHFYVLALSSRADDRTRVLKHDDTFAVLDRYGDILTHRLGDPGLYHEGTRYLSRFDFLINGLRPLLLSSGLDGQNAILTVDMTNPDLSVRGRITLPRGSVHIQRAMAVWKGALHQRVLIRNFGLERVQLVAAVRVESDFADIFEVRGVPRQQPGCFIGPRVSDGAVVIEYVGADRVSRCTAVHCEPAPSRESKGGLEFEVALEPGQQLEFEIRVECQRGERPADAATGFVQAAKGLRDRTALAVSEECQVHTSSEILNNWISRSLADLRLMNSTTPWGVYPYAGVPWFSTPFGRDGAITALEVLWLNPSLARGVLAFMAATQADSVDPAADAQPGKIFHEIRSGEMAATGQVPYARYYGSADSTPLFVMLAGEYLRRTNDVPFVEQIWPNIKAALEWIDRFGDVDGDGFVEYRSSSPQGLSNQGWKDSLDSVFHADGSLASAPIALCEVQGYVFAAKSAAAEIAGRLGDAALAQRLQGEASALAERFTQAFWDEQLGLYAIALDGRKQRCRVATSNPGHCLYTGIATPEHAGRIVDCLLGDRFFTGWGIRTVAHDQPRYNPMAYHNGSVWPHDTAIIAAGMARYGRSDGTGAVLNGLMEATLFAELHRLPELFCGFARRPGEGPIRYPVACAPQSWAAGAVVLLLQACLGLAVDPARGEVHFRNPKLPACVEYIRLTNLSVGKACADLVLQRRGDEVGVNVLKRDRAIRVVVTH